MARIAAAKKAFNSDSEQLNRYLREQVTQDVRRRVVSSFPVAFTNGLRTAGYYTRYPCPLLVDLAASNSRLAAAIRPCPLSVWAASAVDQASCQGLKQCCWLMRSTVPPVPDCCLCPDVVDAKNEAAAALLGITASLPCQTRRFPVLAVGTIQCS